MKKSVIYIVMVLLLILVIGESVYIFMNKKTENIDNKANITEDNKDNASIATSDGVKLKEVKLNNDKIIEEFEITLNGNKKTITVEFTYEYDDKDFFAHNITGKFNEYLFNESVYYSSNNEQHPNSTYTKENTFNIDNIKNIFNEGNFVLIKGVDNKNYLAVTSKRELDSVLYIFNDKLELLNSTKDDIYAPWSEEYNGGFMVDPFGNTPCEFENDINPLYDVNLVLKIEDDKIYYLALTNPNNDLSNAVLEERVYTINNDKLSYEIINKYNAIGVCQQI